LFPVNGKAAGFATDVLTLIDVPCGPVGPVAPVNPVDPVGPVGPAATLERFQVVPSQIQVLPE
jgi:hypothetical protein